jgi:hypothetical protein
MEKRGEELRPTSVRVLGIDISVVYDPDLDEDLLGCFCAERLEVRVRDGLNPENTRLILWHELCHVVESLGEIKISEAGICLMSMGFIQMMKDNPALAWWSFGTPDVGWTRDK